MAIDYGWLYDQMVPLSQNYKGSHGVHAPLATWAGWAMQIGGLSQSHANSLASWVYNFCGWNGTDCTRSGPDRNQFANGCASLQINCPSCPGGAVLPPSPTDIARQIGVPVCVVEEYMRDNGGTAPGDTQAAREYAKSVGMWAPENDPVTPETELWTCTKYGFGTIPGTVPPTNPPPDPIPTPTPTPGNGGGIIPPQTPIDFPKLPDLGAWVNQHMMLVAGIGAGVYVWKFGIPFIKHRRRR